MSASIISAPAAPLPAQAARPLNAFRAWGLGLAAATAAQLLQPALWPLPAYVLCLVLGLAMLVLARAGLSGLRALPRSRALHGAAYVVAGALLGLGGAGLQGSVAMRQQLAPALEGQELQLSGHVAGLPVQLADSVQFTFDTHNPPPGVPARVQLSWYSPPDVAALQPGSVWQLSVRLRAAHGTINFHGFDYELYLLERGVGGVGTVRPRGTQRELSRDVPWRYALDALRSRLDARIARALGDAPYAGVVQALAVGDQSAIARDDWRVFRDTGVGHLMSISGLHVTMFAWLAAGVAGWAWRRSTRLMLWCPAPTAAAWVGLGVAAAYAAVAGWGVPAQRTLFMLAVALLARLGGRRHAAFDVLLAALVGVVLLDPWALLQAGFWLSFAAVAFLFWGGNSDDARRAAGGDTRSASGGDARTASGGDVHGAAAQGWRSRLAAAARTQAVATLALAPLTVLFFHQLSLVSPLANAVAIPLVSLVVTPLAVIGLLLPAPLSTAAWQGAHALIALLQAGLQVLAASPLAVVSLPAPSGLVLALALAGVALLVAPAVGALRWMGALLLAPLLLLAPPRPAPGAFEAQFLDVGQGTAVLIRTAQHTLLYDAGPAYPAGSDAGERIVLPLLRALGTPRLDALVVSHRDTDHSGGAASALGAWPDAPVYSSMPAAELPAAAHVTPCVAGQRWQWDGVQFDMLHPLAGDYARVLKPNAMSCVLKVSAAAGAGGAGGASVLLTGDAEAAQEAAMLARDAPALRATVLLVGHHGSKTSSSSAFLAAVQPQVAVVQAGYRSRYGHPQPGVMARYAAAGIPVHRTDCEGGLRWASDAPGQWLQARAERWRYWRHTGGTSCAGTTLAKPSDSAVIDFEEAP